MLAGCTCGFHGRGYEKSECYADQMASCALNMPRVAVMTTAQAFAHDWFTIAPSGRTKKRLALHIKQAIDSSEELKRLGE